MDHHSAYNHSAPRRPLGDATQRLNHATVANVNRRYQVGDVENHVLSKSKNTTARGRSNPVLTVTYPPPEQRTHKAPAPAAPVEPGPSNPHLAATTQDSQSSSDARRVSQFSNVSSTASTTRQLKTHIGPWQLGKTLGKGASARVRLARHRVSHQLVAIKIVAKSIAHMTQAGSLANLDRIDYRKPTTGADGGLRRMPLAIEREVAILKLIRHPNIIELHDIWENRSEIYMVTEYVEKGDLFEFINWNGPLLEEEAVFYFRQIMTALEYCHSFNICHRDLKPENILLKGNGQIKIADFGMAALQQNPNHQLRTACGSPHYAAPELLRHQYYKGSAVDIWSMGVILFAMLAGHLPFNDDDLDVMMAKAKRAEYKMPPHLTKEAKDLIRRILVDQPAHRITMKQMWRHALMKKYDYLDEYQRWGGQSRDALRNMSTAPIPEEIDVQILRQLKALWHSYSESDLQEKLRHEKPNDQKMFYWLLYNHREAQLENYNNNVPISKSDFHHLKPPNWGKRISTCQFTKPGRNGQTRTVSRFTVISNVADVDDVGTVRSYDPYNASRVLHPSQVSHAKIIVHRNAPGLGGGPSSTTVSHSYRSYRSVNGSFRQRARTNSRRTSTAGELRSPHPSMSSIRSHQSNPRVRANNRSKRSVDFSSVRNKGHRHRRNRHTSLAAPASIGGDGSTYGRDTLSPSPAIDPGAYRVTATQSMMDVADTTEDSFIWSEELEQLGHRIARDCDEAFQSSLLLSESGDVGDDSREASPFMLSLGTLPVTRLSEPAASASGARPWDNRPLPPVPSQDTVSPLSIRKCSQDIESTSQAAKPYKLHSWLDVPIPERRTVSEPAYERPSKDTRPLPPIDEHTPDDWMRRKDVASNSLETPTRAKNKGLDFLARAENTIRVVNSPSAIGADYPVKIPEPLNVRKVSQNTGINKPALAPALKDTAQKHTSYVSQLKSQSMEGVNSDVATPSKKRVSSWFRRVSKESGSSSSFATGTEGSAHTKETCAESEASHLSRPTSQSTDDALGRRAQKKKSFGFAFWKGSRDELKMSLADSDPNDIRTRNNDASTRRRPSKEHRMTSGTTSRSVWSESDGGIRKIEVQQNWLARLFRVKPAMRHLCFNIPKRRTRQEVAILLREWRKYGIKDVEVDKERNIIFARIGAKNYLNLKEVSFAVELMTVIEHGKRAQLSIARFTQEKGAASSFHRVVDAIQAAFGTRALLVTDKRKVGMMVKTLNS